LAAFAVLCTPFIVVLLFDATKRGDRLLGFDAFHRMTYVGAVVESSLLWGLLVYGASRRKGRWRWVLSGLFAIAWTFALGGQRYFHEQYNAYLNVDVSLFASNFVDSVVNQLFADVGNYLAAKLPVLLGALILLWLGFIVVRPRRSRARVAGVLAPLLLVGSFFIPTQHRHVQASMPDVLYLHAVGGLIRTQLGYTEQSNQLRPRARQSLPVVLAHPPSGRRPNILFVILESVRADAVCIEHNPDCRRTPYSNGLTPRRFPFTQMRSQASSTAISLAVLWAGVGPHESRDVLHTWPLIFDYARAAGYDTAFWTSQNMMFGNARLWVKNLGVSQFVSATELDPVADLDMGAPEHLLADHVSRNVVALREPFVAVVQFSNVHYPYYLDEDGPMPFQPMGTSKAPKDNQAFFNLYLNAVHQQDRHVARMVEAVRTGRLGERTVIVYTSDHGEAFREHHQMGHTFSVFDEEIHVPAWIDAPPGMLSAEQERNLAAKRNEFSFHSDLGATLIDLLGVLDDPGLARYRPRIAGTSLLRREKNDRPMPLTNCAGVWSCAFENWGYMQKNMKLEARSWDRKWHCYDLATDPYEENDLGAERCGGLTPLALRTFGRLPGRQPD
jgi:arylsulfatase A-like enzyme